MKERIHKLVAEFEEIETQLGDPEVIADRDAFARLGRRHAELAEHIDLFRDFLANEADMHDAAGMMADVEMKELAEDQLREAKAKRADFEEPLKIALIPKDPNDSKNTIVEVRAGTGGDEAALFVGELARAYFRFAEGQELKIDILNTSDSEAGGLKEIVFKVTGAHAYATFKFEAGTHRVQRIPATESKGRIHTSAVTVAVLPEAEEVDVQIDPQDIKIDTYCSGGAGGQHANRTESAIRITHAPSGIVVTCENERSQHQNKEVAMMTLRSRLLAYEEQKAADERGEERASMVGSGDRSEKIRTYNFPQDRVTDHRIAQSFSNLPGIMEGALLPIVEALAAADIAEKMKGK